MKSIIVCVALAVIAAIAVELAYASESEHKSLLPSGSHKFGAHNNLAETLRTSRQRFEELRRKKLDVELGNFRTYESDRKRHIEMLKQSQEVTKRRNYT
jgi:hypothetical protein